MAVTDDTGFRFLKGKLIQIVIDFNLKRKDVAILANNLSELFNVDFVIFQGFTKDSKLSDFEGQKETAVPKVYDNFFSLISVQKDKIFLARIQNNSGKAFWRSRLKKPTSELFPGYVA